MESLEEKVEELIGLIRVETRTRGLDPFKVFLNGDCGNMYELLASQFPRNAVPYLIKYKKEPYHIVTKIGEKFYDITGETSLEKYQRHLNDNNSGEYKLEDLDIQQLSLADKIISQRQMCDAYVKNPPKRPIYDDPFAEEELDNQIAECKRIIREVYSAVKTKFLDER